MPSLYGGYGRYGCIMAFMACHVAATHSSLDYHERMMQSMTDAMLHEMLDKLPDVIKEKIEELGLAGNELSMEEFARLPESIIKRLNPNVLSGLTAEDVGELIMYVGNSPEGLFHLLSHLNPKVFREFLEYAQQLIDEQGAPSPEIRVVIISAFEFHFGKKLNVEDIELLSPFLASISVDSIRRMKDKETFLALLENLTPNIRKELQSAQARAILQAGLRHWGKTSYWDEEKLSMIGSLMAYMEPSELKTISPAIMMNLLPMLSKFGFEHSRGRIIVNVATQSPGWKWTADQVKDLGSLVQYLHSSEIINLPSDVLAETGDMLVKSVTSNNGTRSQVRNLAKKMKESMGKVEDWGAEEIQTMGPAISGLNVKELKNLPATAVVQEITNLRKGSFSKRQKEVLMNKFKSARNDTAKPISGKELRKLGKLAAGLKSSDFKQMRPQDIRESLETFKEARKEMKKTQKFEIIKKLKETEGGIGEVLVEMGDLASEVPLSSLETISVEQMGFEQEGDNVSEVSNVGKIHWKKSQSMMMFREVVKKQMFADGLDMISAGSLRFLGTLTLGMTCDDIESLLDDTIISVVGVLMEQDGWDKRQLSCMADKVRHSLGGSDNMTASLDEIDITLLTGQLLKELTADELTNIGSQERQHVYTAIGQVDVTNMNRDKQERIANDILKMREKDRAGSVIDSEDLDVLGKLICDVDADALERLSTDVFSNALYDFQHCCLSMKQRKVIGKRIITDFGSPDTWSSDIISNVGNLLMMIKDSDIQKIPRG
uniref:Uncharacterized protein LOC100376646 n=1 Tax=Saccoglossus kowalevskii TaxID=10224 RepID=A0ABM0MVH2_SACKO|nr:PREDICTED: uncharacterized protein LOC100376646 [Saccoglossus kowalevskii]